MASISVVDMNLSSSDADSIKSTSSSGNDSDSSDSSLDSEDLNLESMSTSQFLILPAGDSVALNLDHKLLQSLDSTGGDGDDSTPTASMCISSSTNSLESLDDDPTPTSSICVPTFQKSVPPITIPTPDKEISYARDPYSPSSISHLLPAHLREDQFVTVSEGDALVVLQELTEFLWIVRVCKTDMIGIIPAWNVEGELERVARINMELNGRVSTPVVEIGSPPSSSSDVDSSAPTTPSSSTDDHLPILDSFRPKKLRKVQGPRSVGFQPSTPLVVFRYPSERYIQAEVVAEMSAGWSCGWLEGDDDPEMVMEVVAVPKTTRRGRKRNRKRVCH